MEADFVNAYMQKQREAINELMSRCIMLEAKLSLAEAGLTKAAMLEQQLEQLRAEKDAQADTKKVK